MRPFDDAEKKGEMPFALHSYAASRAAAVRLHSGASYRRC